MSALIDKIKSYDTKIAIIHNDTSYTYKELLKGIAKSDEQIQKANIKQGQVVCIIADYSFSTISMFLALYKNKNIITPITSNVQNEIDEKIKEALSDKIIINGEIINTDDFQKDAKKDNNQKPTLIKNLQDNSQSGLILFSSGSTGKPKAMLHNLDHLIDSYENKKAKSLNMLLFLMFDHIGGINTLLNILSIGSTMIIPKNRDAEHICSLIQKYKIRILPASPTFLNLILISESHTKYNLTSLKMITYGTESMPQSLLNRLKTTFPKVKLLQTFGTSETGIANTSSKSSHSTYMKINDKNLQYKIVKGELWLKSKTQAIGYLNASMESFTDDGWFKSGDIVEQVGDYIKILSRSKEIINVGGEKVLPNEVESTLLEIEGIDDCLVYGASNAITGQSVVCDIVTFKSAKDIKKDIRRHCKNKLDRYKMPTKINIVDKTNFNNRFKKIRLK